MDKIKLMKKITAVAASAAMVVSGAFAATLADFPNNYVQNGKFIGQVVIGANSQDQSTATYLINSLQKRFSGQESMYKITATKTEGSSGDVINAVRDNQELNYGEVLGNVTETAGYDDTYTNVLADQTFKNNKKDEDYEQTLYLDPDKKIEFNYALWDNVDGVHKITDGLYIPDGIVYAKYVLDMDSPIELTSSDDLKKDFVGKDLTIMGKKFVVTNIGTDTSNNWNELELLGGSNEVTLKEGQSTTVTVNGQTYNVEVVAVSSGSPDQVLVKVNGQTDSIDEYDTDTVGGVTVGVIDAFPSSRDSVPGYATLVVGGQKITLENGKKVQINDQDIDDVYPEYIAYAYFEGSGINKITIDYEVKDDTLLKKGDKLEDPLFHAFNLEYDGTNDVTYSEVDVNVDSNKLRIDGTTEKGKDLDLQLYTDSTNHDKVYIRGDQDTDRIFFKDSKDIYNPEGISFGESSILNVGPVNKDVYATFTNNDLADYRIIFGADSDVPVAASINKTAKTITVTEDWDNSTGNASVSLDNLSTAINTEITNVGLSGDVTLHKTGSSFNASEFANAGSITLYNDENSVVFDLTNTGIKGSGFLLSPNDDDQYMYEITSVDPTDTNREVDFEEYLRGDDQDNVKYNEWASKLGDGNVAGVTYAGNGNWVAVPLNSLGNFIKLQDNSELVLGGSYNNGTSTTTFNVETGSLNSGSYAAFVIKLDPSDVDADEDYEKNDGVMFTLNWDSTDREFNINNVQYYNDYTSGADIHSFENQNKADETDDSSDVEDFVTRYGIKVVYDNKDYESAKVYIPNREVDANVKLVFGNANTDTETFTVSADQLDAKKAELEKEGYSVQVEELSQPNVEFDLNNYVTDADVTAQDHNLIVIGGPAVNKVAADLLGIPYGTTGDKGNVGVNPGEAIVKYYNTTNTVLAYGWSASDTKRAVDALLDNKVSGTEQKV